MNESYYFRTSDPDYIRHAPSRLEILSKAFPTIITQQEIGRYKQRISRVLNRLGYAGPATGTFSMMRHMPDGPEARILWVPQLCLFLPNDSTLIKGLKAHMSRSSGEFIDETTVNTPVIVPRYKDPARLLSCALDPAWRTLTDKDALV
ncbi:TPA: hypothetical protein RST32_005192, partial [Klebsiella pneumoniae]|nr:hypothetical protein [Klebsiella pneumoniae]